MQPSSPGPRPTRRGADALIEEIAARQHGAVSRTQLVRAGLGVHVVDWRVKSGQLVPLHRGVYRASIAGGAHMREMAAVLAGGDGTELSHRSATALWTLRAPLPSDAPVEITVSGGRRCEHAGVRAYRVAGLSPAERTVHDGIPVTTPARTLLDLAGVAGARELEQALAAAERRGLASRASLHALMEMYPRHRGRRALEMLLRASNEPAFTRSEAEERLLALLRKARLPLPGTNVILSGFEVDFFWPSARLVVEVDGYAFHSSPAAFERDRRRDAVLAANGVRVIRLSWRQLVEDAEATLVLLAVLIAGGSAGNGVGGPKYS